MASCKEIDVKLTFDGEIRRFPFVLLGDDLLRLRDEIARRFPSIASCGEVTLRYCDDDGDEVTIMTCDEFCSCLADAKRNQEFEMKPCIRIKVTRAVPKAAAAATTANGPRMPDLGQEWALPAPGMLPQGFRGSTMQTVMVPPDSLPMPQAASPPAASRSPPVATEIDVKLTFDGEIRRFPFVLNGDVDDSARRGVQAALDDDDYEDDLLRLRREIARRFPSSASCGEVTLRYCDDDGDEVTIMTRDEFCSCLADAKRDQECEMKPCIRIKVTQAAPEAAAAPTTADAPQVPSPPGATELLSPLQPSPPPPAPSSPPAAPELPSTPSPPTSSSLPAAAAVPPPPPPNPLQVPSNMEALLGTLLPCVLGVAAQQITNVGAEQWLPGLLQTVAALAPPQQQQQPAATAPTRCPSEGAWAGAVPPAPEHLAAPDHFNETRAVPAAGEPVVHGGITCDGCGASPIVGARFKCAVRDDFDLCSACEADDQSPFPYLKIKTPEQAPAAIVCVLRAEQHLTPAEAAQAALAAGEVGRYRRNARRGSYHPSHRWRRNVTGGEAPVVAAATVPTAAETVAASEATAAAAMAVTAEVEAVAAEVEAIAGVVAGATLQAMPAAAAEADAVAPVEAATVDVAAATQEETTATAAGEGTESTTMDGKLANRQSNFTAQDDPFQFMSPLPMMPSLSPAATAAIAAVPLAAPVAAPSDSEENPFMGATEEKQSEVSSMQSLPQLWQIAPCDSDSSSETPAAAAPAAATTPAARIEEQLPRPSSVRPQPSPPSRPMARFVSDVTTPDGTALLPNTRFVKTWRLRNEGCGSFGGGGAADGVRLRHVGGDLMAGPIGGVPVEATQAPGMEFDVSVALSAPPQAGRYIGYWRMFDKDGWAFGHRLWVDIMVVDEAASTPEVLAMRDGEWSVLSLTRNGAATENSAAAQTDASAPNDAGVHDVAGRHGAAAQDDAAAQDALLEEVAAALEPPMPDSESRSQSQLEIQSETHSQLGDSVELLAVWEEELTSLAEMGFTDVYRCAELLRRRGVKPGSGDIAGVIADLLG